jgi:phenylpropionate dioxygenase-like ring-hydroxylating dioxygenase large terminal subunit
MGNVSTLLESVSSSLGQGYLPARIFSDPTIFELEMERIFSRVWLYVGHESEVPNPGDFVVRNLAGESFLFIRGRDGQLRVLLNTCRHRGNRVCLLERGNAPNFRCPYHGWVYENTGALLNVPVMKEAYGEALDRREWGLVPAPRVDQWNGLVFASLNPNASSLVAYLGDMKWYLDLTTNRGDSGLEVVGAPRRWLINANWKLPADNFVGDTLHFWNLHSSVAEIGDVHESAHGVTPTYSVSMKNGHGVFVELQGAEADVSLLFLRNYPETLVESLKRNLTPEQVWVLDKAPAIGGNIFPNLGYMDTVFTNFEGGMAAALPLRVWQPLSPEKTEICSWFLVEKDAPEDFKQRSYSGYMRGFGPGGAFEQDDVQAWCAVTQSSKGLMGRRLFQNISRGTAVEPPQAKVKFPGPGDVALGYFTDLNWRVFYRNWLQHLLAEE